MFEIARGAICPYRRLYLYRMINVTMRSDHVIYGEVRMVLELGGVEWMKE